MLLPLCGLCKTVAHPPSSLAAAEKLASLTEHHDIPNGELRFPLVLLLFDSKQSTGKLLYRPAPRLRLFQTWQSC